MLKNFTVQHFLYEKSRQHIDLSAFWYENGTIFHRHEPVCYRKLNQAPSFPKTNC